MAAAPRTARRSWATMLRTMRAPVAVLLVGGLGLTVPTQIHDLLASLGGGSSGLRAWPAISFQLAMVVFGAAAWFWSRAALAARFGVDDDHRDPRDDPAFDWAAFTWLPRLILVAVFAIGVAIAVISGQYWSAGDAACVGLLALLFTILRPRRAGGGPGPAPRDGLIDWLLGGGWRRLVALLARAPGGRAVALPVLLISLVPLVCGIVEAFAAHLGLPNRLAALFPGPGVAVLLLGLMIGPLTVTTFVFDGLTFRITLGRWRFGLARPPVLVLLTAWVFVVVPLIDDLHTVRLRPGPPAVRKPLGDLFKTWVDACAPGPEDIRPIVVAISGGATRAGLWGAAVLDHVLQAQQGNARLFAVSSVSGGSLGAAAAITLLSHEPVGCLAGGLPALRPHDDKPVPLAGDALGPLLAGWLLDDIPRAFFEPLAGLLRGKRHPDGGDSAEAIERAFEDLWMAAAPPGALPWSASFLSLFYGDAGPPRTGMPLWFANGTDAGTGNRVITAPILADAAHPTPWPFRGARDFHALMGADVSIATAINNTARFPYLEPFGEMLPAAGKTQVGSLVDGGYFENEGLQTALDLAGWLEDQSKVLGRTVEPIIVQATGDGEAAAAGGVMTCAGPSDGAFIADTAHGAWQILAPLAGLYHVRGGHSAVLLREAYDRFCPGRNSSDPGRFVHFYLPDDHGIPIPLNWVLSQRTAQDIWGMIDRPEGLLATETGRLRTALGPPR